MYVEHFGLREPPFAITPDPAYVYLSPHHREALAHLLYGTHENGGFVQLTGEVGTGKTTLVRSLLEQKLEQVDIALCWNPRLTVEELLATVCDELSVAYPREPLSLKALVDALNQHLLRVHAAGRRTVLIIDEAQNLSREVLEQIRLLTNLETAKHKLLRIILVGQPELRTLLERPDLRQLAQRITARYHLPSLNAIETAAYIRHRLHVAGRREDVFSRGALRAIHRGAGGIPRLINIICDRALLGAYSQNRKHVNTALVRQAAREALPRQPGTSQAAFLPFRPALLAGLIGLLLIGAALWLPQTDNAPTPEVASAPVTAPKTAPVFAATPSQTAPAPITTPSQTASTPIAAAAPSQTAPVPIAAAAPSQTASAPIAAAAPSQTAPAQTAPAPIAAAPAYAANATPPSSVESDAPPASLPMQADLAALLQSTSMETTNQRLLALWGISPFQGRAAAFCEHVKTHSLRCMSGQGDLEMLRRFNRPAILSLHRSDGVTAPVLLKGLDADKATLEVAGHSVQVTSAQLKPLWTGAYLLLWKLQTDQPIIGPGNNGEAVRWLRRRLAIAAGQPVPETPSERFDADLGNQVRAFQQTHNLLVDGIAGEQTLVLLNNITPTPGVPLLTTPLMGP